MLNRKSEISNQLSDKDRTREILYLFAAGGFLIVIELAVFETITGFFEFEFAAAFAFDGFSTWVAVVLLFAFASVAALALASVVAAVFALASAAGATFALAAFEFDVSPGLSVRWC